MTPLCGKCQRAFLTSHPESQFRGNPSYMFLSAPMWLAPYLTFASWKHILVPFIRPYPNISLTLSLTLSLSLALSRSLSLCKTLESTETKKNKENETILKKMFLPGNHHPISTNCDSSSGPSHSTCRISSGVSFFRFFSLEWLGPAIFILVSCHFLIFTDPYANHWS